MLFSPSVFRFGLELNMPITTDSGLRALLTQVKTIAMVGASTTETRPSYGVMKYLQGKGFRVIPVNPGAAGQAVLGETIYATLANIPVSVDMVDMFRKADAAPEVAAEAIAINAKVLWMQLGIEHAEAAATAEAAGLQVVMNRCPKIEYARLFGELDRR